MTENGEDKTNAQNEAALFERSARAAEAARRVLERCGVVAIWEEIGATVNLVGSLRMGLTTPNRRDVDLHIYSDEVSVAESFRSVGALASRPGVRRVEFANFLATEERCVQWRVWLVDPSEPEETAEEWALGLIHIERKSKYDGYFENVADRVAAALTTETKRAILTIKEAAPDDEKIAGIEVYRAVLEGGVRDWGAFLDWRRTRPLDGVLEWLP
jgi:hypothetical protein